MKVMVDITEPATRWIRFIREDLAIDEFSMELAILIYNKEYENIEAFLHDLEGYQHIEGVDEGWETGEYIYDFIFENIEEYLSNDIDKILGRSGLAMADVVVIANPDTDRFIAYAYFEIN